MKRFEINKLVEWKNQSRRKPLLLQGTRQVGKTYLLEEFGREHFENYHLFDFTSSKQLCQLFKQDLDPRRIIEDLSVFCQKYSPKQTVLFLGKPLDIKESSRDNYPLYLASLFPLK